MLDSNQIAAASQTLHDHWRAGTKLANLGASERPRDRAEGYAIQAAIETVLPDGGTASMAGNEMAVGEPEFAFRMQTDLPPRSTPYSVQQVLDAVGTLHPAIEIPDSRFADFVSAGPAQIIADNACAHLFVLGASTGSDWRALDLVEHKPVIKLRGQQYVGHGRNVLGDPRVALAWLANELRQLGVTLRAGEVVTTGTCHPPLPIQSGDLFEADFGAIGKVSVRFE